MPNVKGIIVHNIGVTSSGATILHIMLLDEQGEVASEGEAQLKFGEQTIIMVGEQDGA